MRPAPRFITLEGGEGAGKSTQLKLLAQALQQERIATLITREPGGSQGGERIRQLVVSGAAEEWSAVTESLLFMTARYDHIERSIRPALLTGQWVLCDRFYDSTFVYQGIAKQVGTAWLDQLYALLFGNIRPDLTLLLDLNPKHGLSRAEKRGNHIESRFEQMGLKYHQKIREGFLSLAERDTRIQVVDASSTVALVHEQIIAVINTRFGLALQPAAGA